MDARLLFCPVRKTAGCCRVLSGAGTPMRPCPLQTSAPNSILSSPKHIPRRCCKHLLPGGKAANTCGTVARMRAACCWRSAKLPISCLGSSAISLKSEDVLLQKSAGLGRGATLSTRCSKIFPRSSAALPVPTPAAHSRMYSPADGPPVHEQTRDGPVQHPPAKILLCWLMALGR
jgi:hypothetical protein